MCIRDSYTIIDPKKFDIGSYDNCTPKEKLKFTAEPFSYNCDSLGTRNLKIWVEDEAGNKKMCIRDRLQAMHCTKIHQTHSKLQQ